jgi:type I restriction enzyme S subunit
MSSHLPQGWKLKSVGELSNVKRGASPRPIKDPKWWGGKTGWVRISDVTSSRKYLKKTTQYLSDKGVNKSVQIDKGEVVLTICATIGRAIIISVDACIHDGFVWFDKLGQSINREFWYYFLASKEDFFKAQRQSGTQGNLNTSIVSNVLCMLPPLPEQQKIAAILTSVDEVIEKIQAQIDKLKDLKTGMMQELLTKGIGHTEFKDSPVGVIPVGWEVKTLLDVCSSKYAIVDGPFGSNLKTEHYRPTGVPVFQSGFVTSNKFIKKKYVYVEQNKYDEQIRSSAGPEDILMAKIGMNAGACAIIPFDHPIGILAGNSLKITVDKNIALNTYLLGILHFMQDTGDIRRLLTETAQPAISITTLKKMCIPIPPLAEQQKIINLLESIDVKVDLITLKYGAKLKVKKALMQDLLTGKVRVNT